MWVWLSLLLLGCIESRQARVEKKLYAVTQEMQQPLPQGPCPYSISIHRCGEEVQANIDAENQPRQQLLLALLDQAGVGYINHLPNIQGLCTLHLKNADLLMAVAAILDSQQASVTWSFRDQQRLLLISEQHSLPVHHKPHQPPDLITARSLKLQHQRSAAVLSTLFSSGTKIGIFPRGAADVTTASNSESNSVILHGPAGQVAAGLRMAKACDQPAKAIEIEVVIYSLKPDRQLANQGLQVKLDGNFGSFLYQLTAKGNNGLLFNSLPVAAASTLNIDGLALVQLQKISVLQRFAARVANGEEIKLSRGLITYIQGSTFQSGLSYLSAQSIFTGAKLALTPLAISNSLIRVDVKSERAAEPLKATPLAGNVSQATLSNKIQIRAGEWVLIGGTQLISRNDRNRSYAFTSKIPIIGQLLPKSNALVVGEIVMSWLRCKVINDDSDSLFMPNLIAPQEAL